MKKASKLMAAVLGVVLLLSAASPLYAHEEAEKQAGAAGVDQSLQVKLESYVADLGETYGVAALNMDDGRLVSINADEVFPSASMYKPLVMYRVYQEIEKGELSLGDQITIFLHFSPAILLLRIPLDLLMPSVGINRPTSRWSR